MTSNEQLENTFDSQTYESPSTTTDRKLDEPFNRSFHTSIIRHLQKQHYSF